MTEIDDIRSLTARYYTRLGELLSEVPAGELSAGAGAEGLTAAEIVGHVCRSDLWYLELIDGVPRPSPEPPPEREALLALLRQSEETVVSFLEALPPETLATTREVPAWWAEGGERSVRLVLMHSLAHKYYHCGQLQSILHRLSANE